jgi:Uma2 family endonuclease
VWGHADSVLLDASETIKALSEHLGHAEAGFTLRARTRRELLRRCMQSRPELDLHIEQGLRVEAYRSGHARPDGVLAPIAHFAGQGEWADPRGALMAVEVTSYDPDTDRRDRVEKPAACAEAGIPVYLLIDRDTCETVVHSPGLGITVETEILKQYVR